MKFLLNLFFLFQVSLLFSAETAIPLDLIQSLLPQNPIVIEAGAQFGEDTDKMSVLWPNGILYAFEPSPDSYPSLLELSEKRDNIFCFQSAVSNKKGTLPFYLSGGASSLLPPEDQFNRDYFHVDLDNPIFVDVIVLDEWMEEQGIAKVDFLWFDMEGNELNALKGFENHLPETTLIYTEVNIQKFWNDCVCYDELTQWLEERGFIEIWSEVIPGWQGNALFINSQK